MGKGWRLCGLLLSAACALAQSDRGAKLQFDVVSIKLNQSGQPRGMLAVSPDGNSIVVSNAPMYRIVAFAFDFLRNDLVLGAPEWTRSERWDSAPPTSLFTAIQEQLGLRLEPARAVVDALLVEHIERPTSN